MRRRLLLTLVALAAGWCVLLGGLLVLDRVFRQERDEGRQALADGRRAVEQYATRSFADELQSELRRALPTIDAAAGDPLRDDAALLRVRHGRQVLPRTARPDEARAPEAEALWSRLSAPGERSTRPALGETEDPTADRLALVRAAAAAFASGTPAEAELAVKRWLAHRVNYAIPTIVDVASALWLMERARDSDRASPDLLAAVLREGLSGASGTRIEGLQRTLLASPEKFAPADFIVLRDRLVALSERSHVAYVDFRERASPEPAPPVDAVLPLDGPTLRPDGWYLEPDGEGGARGMRIHPASVLAGIREAMLHRALLDASDALAFRDPNLGELGEIAVVLDSPRLREAESSLDARYRLKAGMLAVLAVLALGIVGLAALAHQRKLRFVQLRSDFVSTVSHELKTPLSAIRVMAETLERRLANVPAAADYPTRIVSEADALTRLVENILTFNRLDKGRWDSRRDEVRLDDLVGRVVQDAAALLPAKIELDVSGLGDARVRGDPELLRILFANLVHNACRYTHRAPVRLRVDAAQGATLTVQFTDNGAGIPRQSWGLVFEEFRRLPNAALPAKGGSGLGLAICRRIMALHGGTLAIARSSPDGTTFLLTFPA